MDLRRQRLKVLCAGICSLVLGLGVARFAYTPLLPLMRAQAGLGVAAAGWLATINYAGYLAGALLSSVVKDLVAKDRLYRIGLLAAVASTALMPATDSVVVWGVSRFVAGLSTASAMMLGTALTLNWLVRHGQRPELGIHFSGLGLGIALSAATVAVLSPTLDWRAQWWVFTLLGALFAVPALAWLPAPDRSRVTTAGVPLADRPPASRFLTVLMAAYFCAGVGYVVSATFIVAIIDARPGLAGQGTAVFLWLGLASAPACIVWDLVARRTGEITALTLAALLQIIGIVLPVWPGTYAWAMLGAILFGASFVGIVSLVLTMAGRYYPTQPAKIMGRMTAAYGVAQIITPAVTASLALRTGGYASGLYVAAVAMATAAALFASLHRLAPRT